MMGGRCVTPPINTPHSKSHNNNNNLNHSNKYSILSSGIDTLVLSIYLTWENDNLFDELEIKKKEAQTINGPVEGKIEDFEYDYSWSYKIWPKGKGGYEYVLTAPDYALKIAKVKTKGVMPDVLVEIRSETIWTLGVEEAVERILNIIKMKAAEIEKIKPSRVDLCVDITMPEKEWSHELKQRRVCRSSKVHGWEMREGDLDVLETIQIGKGDLIARIYDKIKEIIDQSRKYWMYGVWGIEEFNPGTKIIRVEFQLRRPILKAFGIDSLNTLYSEKNGLWAYLTQNWLKFLEKPEKNKDRQRVHPWWEVVQGGFGERCEPSARVRHIAVRLEQEQMTKRSLSSLENLMASEIAATMMPRDVEYSLEDSWKILERQRDRIGLSDLDFSNNVKKKVVNYQRQDNEKMPF